MRRPFFALASAGLVQATSVLASPMRRRLYELIEARPGISIRALAHMTSSTWPNVKYHVLRLESARLVETRLLGRRRVCFAARDAEADVLHARAMLAEKTARALAAHLVHHPGQSLPEIVAATGLSQRVVYYHLKRFRDAGLVVHADDALYRGLRPTAALYRALE